MSATPPNRLPELPPASRAGLCVACRHVQRIESAKGSVFLLCTLAKTDPRFPKYPPQPVRACSGFAAAT
jgi:hypothetical protein